MKVRLVVFGHAADANSVSIVDLTVLQAINSEFSIYALKSPLIQLLNFSFAFVSSSVFLKGVSSSVLLEKINCNNKLLLQEKEVVTALKDRYLEVVLTLGAGDIDQLVSPIKNMLTAKLEIN